MRRLRLDEIKDEFQKNKSLAGMLNKTASARFHKSYLATLTQTGTAAPVATVLENQLSAPIVWARTGVGVYTGTLTGAFTVGKTIATISQPAAGKATIAYTSANVITISTFDATPVAADAILAALALEIRVYP